MNTLNLQEEGHFAPYEMNGNAPAEVLRGNKLLMLALFRAMYPKATADEVFEHARWT